MIILQENGDETNPLGYMKSKFPPTLSFNNLNFTESFRKCLNEKFKKLP